ncbi:addiction module antidote protein [Pseudoduganella sp. UC29_71]|uniref:addiction module antidote protein n=1 Tax=Pseudoduganella sp. UC29_71 TaxID=3350174 RepID=UPI00366AA7E9
MIVQLREWDGSKYLETSEDIALYLAACFEEDGSDAAFIARVLDDISRSAGLRHVATEAGIDADALATALVRNGLPNFDAMLTLVNALGLQFRIEPTAA